MSDAELSEKAALLRDEAEQLLQATSICGLLVRRFGDCAVVGSFDFDLMTRRDLDIWVPLGSFGFAALFAELVRCCADARKTLFRARYNDEVFRPRGDYGNGLYYGLHIAAPGACDWKIDLWGWPAGIYQSKLAAHERLKTQLRQLNRSMLLEAKAIAARLPQFGNELTSYSIYQAAVREPSLAPDALVRCASVLPPRDSIDAVPVFGERDPAINYKTRPSAYAIITDASGRIAVVKTSPGFYLPGGGLEDGEDAETAVARECREECDIQVSDLSFVGSAVQLLFAPGEGGFRIEGNFYVANCARFSAAQTCLWIEPEDAVDLMTRQFERWAIQTWRDRTPR